MKFLFILCIVVFLNACSGDSGNSTSKTDSAELKNCVAQHQVLEYSEMPQGNSDILMAIMLNDTLEFDSILAAGIAIDGVNEYGTTSLASSVSMDRLYMFDKLIAKGANPNIFDSDGYTAIHMALNSRSSHKKHYVEQLLLAGASVTVIDANGWDLLVWCNDDAEIETLLLNQCHN